MPRRKETHAVLGETQIGQDREAMIALEGPAEITVDDIEVIKPENMGDRVEVEAFFEEMVKVIVHPDGSQFPEDPVPLGVNGRMCYVFRNKPTMMKRKYLYQLAKAKADSISQDPANPDPTIANKLSIRSVPRYPHSLIEDTQKGHEWHRAVLAEI
jgi:hypothetical protein